MKCEFKDWKSHSVDTIYRSLNDGIFAGVFITYNAESNEYITYFSGIEFSKELKIIPQQFSKIESNIERDIDLLKTKIDNVILKVQKLILFI